MTFKERICKWLGINSLAKDLKDTLEVAILMEKRIGELEAKVKYLNSLVDVGVDLHPYHRDASWCIVSLRGKRDSGGRGTDYIKFYDLADKDLLLIRDFLKQFEGANTKINKPPHTFFK